MRLDLLKINENNQNISYRVVPVLPPIYHLLVLLHSVDTRLFFEAKLEMKKIIKKN
jgi:hypothetical protein